MCCAAQTSQTEKHLTSKQPGSPPDREEAGVLPEDKRRVYVPDGELWRRPLCARLRDQYEELKLRARFSSLLEPYFGSFQNGPLPIFFFCTVCKHKIVTPLVLEYYFAYKPILYQPAS